MSVEDAALAAIRRGAIALKSIGWDVEVIVGNGGLLSVRVQRARVS